MAPRPAPVEEVIDLRDAALTSTRTHAVLALLRGSSTTEPDVVVDVLRSALEDEVVIAQLQARHDVGARSWGEFLKVAEQLRRPTRYVGSFRTGMAAAAAAAEAIAAPQRPAAVSLLVALCCEFAPNEHDFRHGIRVASRIDPVITSPRAVVDRLLRPALARQSSGRPLAGAHALKLVLEVLAQPGGPHLLARDFWPVRAAIAQLTDADRASVQQLTPGLHRSDRRRIEELLEPARRRRRSSWGVTHGR